MKLLAVSETKKAFSNLIKILPKQKNTQKSKSYINSKIMCICKQQTDARSDFTLLEIPLSLHNNNDDFSSSERGGGGGGERHFLNNTIYSSDENENDNDTKISSFEMVLRVTMIFFLLFVSVSLHRQHQEVAAQRTKLLESMRSNREAMNDLLRGSRSSSSRSSLFENDEFGFVERDVTDDGLPGGQVVGQIDYGSILAQL